MESPEVLADSCPGCGSGLEFAVQSELGSVCSGCGQLRLLAEVVTSKMETSRAPAVTIAEITRAFAPRVPAVPTTAGYRAGLIVVAVLMVVLAGIYHLATVGVAVAGTVAWAWWGIRLAGFRWVGLLVYGVVLFAGSVVATFLLKPWLAAPRRRAQPLALNPAAEPVLYTFITRICESIGAPYPSRVDVDCHLNAQAGFRRGLRSFLGHDFVLTLGLPLTHGLTARQLAGVIAHEFGHFSQGFGMRMSYLIESVNGWLTSRVYERDSWDDRLEEMVDGGEGLSVALASTAQLGIGVTRGFLWVFMMCGRVVSCHFSRQMEYHADRYAMGLVGSETLETTSRRIAQLALGQEAMYRAIRSEFAKSGALPDDLSRMLLSVYEEIPDYVTVPVDNRLGLVEADAWSTHPSPAERIREARQQADPGCALLDPELPASALFSHPEVLSKQVTLLYYADEVGLPLSEFKLLPVTERASVPAESLPSVEEILLAERHDGTVPRWRLSSKR